MKSRELKVLTYNCWHALTSHNFVQFRELEPVGRKQQRYQLQLDQIKQLDADIVFLQEVSPIHSRVEDFKALGYDVCMQVDQSGIKFFGFGLPQNLSTGLVILAKPSFSLKKLFGQKLSGMPGFTGVDFSFQITENRYALFASSDHPDFGRSLLICTHLHHGTEQTPLIEEMLNRASQSGFLTSEELEISRSEMRAADLRRKNELDILFSAAHVFENKFDQIILAGDINSSESSKAYTQIMFDGYFDTYRTKHFAVGASDYSGYTWDISQNAQNISYGHEFELPMSTFGKNDVKNLFTKYNDRKRRIDFIFVKSLLNSEIQISPSFSPAILSSEVLKFGSPSLLGSDHLAVCSRIEMQSRN